MGYMILYRNDGSKFGRAIQAKQEASGFTNEQACYTHCEISGGSEYSINISPPLSKLVDITQKHKGRYIKIVRYKDKYYEEKGRYKVAYFSASLCNLGYDIRGILHFIFKWIKESNRHYFCSEGAAWALQKVIPNAFDGRQAHRIMPAHFTNKEFENVWEGILP